VVKASQPLHGTMVPNADGSFTYTPASDYSGDDSFTYTASDGKADSNVATVTITVTAPATDTVTIPTATWTRRTPSLVVEATSSAAPTAALTASGQGFSGTMTYSSKTKRYKYQTTIASAPPQVTVTSSFKGTATKTVTMK
jgi:hypothetical protein